MVFVFGNAHTQHAFTKGQCCVSAILDLLLQLRTGEWCHGAKMDVAFSCLPINSVACWCVGRLLMER